MPAGRGDNKGGGLGFLDRERPDLGQFPADSIREIEALDVSVM